MDFHLKQWRNQQHESEEEEEQPPSAKMPKLVMETHQPQNPSSSSLTYTAPLPLFVPEPTCKLSHLSAFPDSTQVSSAASATTRSFPKMGGSYFSLAQWQELELQALIYRYMLAGASVPPELLQPIKKSLLSTPHFLHQQLQHYSYYQTALLQSGYWGKAAMDPEPGRCRRTDGKKWRCSRDVVSGQKYCERHVHRGRNRSRKPVEIPTPTSSTNTTSSIGIGGGAGGAAFNSTSPTVAPPLAAVANGTSFSFSGLSSSTEQLHANNGPSDTKPEIKGLLGPQNEVGNRSDGHILRHFFDDWPRSLQEPDSNAGSNASQLNSATCLSISMPGNSTSDVSLKLSTGLSEEQEGHGGGGGREQPQVNWNGGWGTIQVASMGGPLAEALRSSTSNSSPTSVLHHLPRGSASETSYVST